MLRRKEEKKLDILQKRYVHAANKKYTSKINM